MNPTIALGSNDIGKTIIGQSGSRRQDGHVVILAEGKKDRWEPQKSINLDKMKELDRKLLVATQIDSPDILRAFLRFWVEAAEYFKGAELTKAQYTGHLLLLRFARSSFSLWHVFFPTKIPELLEPKNEFLVADVTSGFLTVRSLYESFLVVSYLLQPEVSDEERELRRAVWLRSGAKTGFVQMTTMPNPPESKLKLAQTRMREADAILQDLQIFKSLTEAQKTALLKCKKPTPLKYDELAKLCGVNTSFHDSYYRFLSSHAHPDWSSFRNIGEVSEKVLSEILAKYYRYIAGSMYLLVVRELPGFEHQNKFVLSTASQIIDEFVKNYEKASIKKLL